MNRQGLTTAIALLLALVCTAEARPQAAVGPVAWETAIDPDSLEGRMLADAADGQLDAHTSIEAALIAGGVQEHATLRAYAARFEDWLATIRQSSLLEGTSLQRAEALFAFMHRHVLTGGYQADCTELTELFDTGCYNCVSATVLFHALAEQCGLRIIVVEAPSHLYCLLEMDQNRRRIETTCPTWFEVLDNPLRQRRALEQLSASAAATLPAGAACRELRKTELPAAIYYNRGVDLLQRQQFAAALTANVKAHRLDPASQTARGNLLATINNWALHLAGEGQFQPAVDLLASGRDFAPDHESFHVNYVAVNQRWLDHLIETGQHERALLLARQLHRELPQQAYFNPARFETLQ